MSIAVTMTKQIKSLRYYLKLSQTYLKRHNPLMDISNKVVAQIKNWLTLNKKLKIAKYRVNHLSYRLHQMETLIENGNPTQINSGNNLNFLR